MPFAFADCWSTIVFGWLVSMLVECRASAVVHNLVCTHAATHRTIHHNYATASTTPCTTLSTMPYSSYLLRAQQYKRTFSPSAHELCNMLAKKVVR